MQTRLTFEYPVDWEDGKFYPKVTLTSGGDKYDSGLLAFFSLMKPIKYASYFEAILEKKVFNFYEYGTIVFGPQDADLWGEVAELSEDDVLIGIWEEEAKFPYEELFEYSRDFASALVEILQKRIDYFDQNLSEAIKSSALNFLDQTELPS